MGFTDFIYTREFLFGILSGIVATVVCSILAKLLKSLGAILSDVGIINIWKNSKILHIYNNYQEAEKKLYSDAIKSKKIYLFVTRGVMFTEEISKLNKLLKRDNCDIRFLLLDTNSQAAKSRANELKMDNMAEKLNTSKTTLEALKKKYANINFAVHSESLRLGIYIFDKVMYLDFKLKEESSTNLPMFRIRHDSILYKSLSQQFDDYWEKYYKPPISEHV